MIALHAGIFPFDGQRAIVMNSVQSANDFLEVDAAAANRAEFPTAARIAEFQMRTENASLAVEVDDSVFDVAVENTIREFTNEFDGVDSLTNQVAWFKVEDKFRSVVDRFQIAVGRVNV